MPSLSAITIALFGITALLAGASTTLNPSLSLSTLNLPESARPAVLGNGLASFAMGLYYTLAAFQENKTFFVMTVPMRGLTALVFWGQGGPWKMPAVWEGGAAVVTGLALVWEGVQVKEKRS